LLNYFTFINCFLWLLFISFVSCGWSFFSLLLLSELVWVILYTLSIFIGSIIDDAGCVSLAFFFLGLASVELSVGLTLLVFMKYIKLSITFTTNKKKIDNQLFNKLLSKRFTKLVI
jgi:NADH:ubiquinone oxidoreductase subunit K